ncbi:MAG: type II secretion system protein, partial [Planctomycetota bacterium]
MNYVHIKRGFTLIELLVVIAIIGMLSSVILASLNTARQKARDARRLSDMKQIQTALELYYDTNRAYPNPGWAWRSQCAAWGGVAADQVIPGLVPTY